MNTNDTQETTTEELYGNNQIQDPKIRHYFNQLENLGDITNSSPTKIVDRTNVGLAKVGAKPLSGIRGLYFNKGMWKVKFLDDDLEVVTCIFRYGDKESLVESYHLAHLFLKKVIEYNRQIHEDDGTVLEKLNEDQLVELDKRKTKIGLQSPSRTYNGDTYSSQQEREKYDFLIQKRSRKITQESDKNTYPSLEILKKKRKKAKSSKNAKSNHSKPGTHKVKQRKLTKFEAKFLKYSEYGTLEMIHKVIDDNREFKSGDHGKIYCDRHREWDSKEKVLENSCDKMLQENYALADLDDESAVQLLKKSSFKEDLDEDRSTTSSTQSTGEGQKEGKTYYDEDALMAIRSYKFDNCFIK